MVACAIIMKFCPHIHIFHDKINITVSSMCVCEYISSTFFLPLLQIINALGLKNKKA